MSKYFKRSHRIQVAKTRQTSSTKKISSDVSHSQTRECKAQQSKQALSRSVLCAVPIGRNSFEEQCVCWVCWPPVQRITSRISNNNLDNQRWHYSESQQSNWPLSHIRYVQPPWKKKSITACRRVFRRANAERPIKWTVFFLLA